MSLDLAGRSKKRTLMSSQVGKDRSSMKVHLPSFGTPGLPIPPLAPNDETNTLVANGTSKVIDFFPLLVLCFLQFGLFAFEGGHDSPSCARFWHLAVWPPAPGICCPVLRFETREMFAKKGWLGKARPVRPPPKTKRHTNLSIL